MVQMYNNFDFGFRSLKGCIPTILEVLVGLMWKYNIFMWSIKAHLQQQRFPFVVPQKMYMILDHNINTVKPVLAKP
jgi:AMMECR1 domain-containing protein